MTEVWKISDTKGPKEDPYAHLRNEDGKLPKDGIDVTPKFKEDVLPGFGGRHTYKISDQDGPATIVIEDNKYGIIRPEKPLTQQGLKALARVARFQREIRQGAKGVLWQKNEDGRNIVGVRPNEIFIPIYDDGREIGTIEG